jgi:capsular exopolysaccharide synthesis family protein
MGALDLLEVPLRRWYVFFPVLVAAGASYGLWCTSLAGTSSTAKTEVTLAAAGIPAEMRPELDRGLENLLNPDTSGAWETGLTTTGLAWDAAQLLLGAQSFAGKEFRWQDRQERLAAAALELAGDAIEGDAASLARSIEDGVSFAVGEAGGKAAAPGDVTALTVVARNARPERALVVSWAAAEALRRAHKRAVGRLAEEWGAQIAAEEASRLRERSIASRALREIQAPQGRKPGGAGPPTAGRDVEAARERLAAQLARAEDALALIAGRKAQLAVLLETASSPDGFALLDLAERAASQPLFAGEPSPFIACALALLLAVLGATGAETLDTRLRRPRDIPHELGLPLLGVAAEVAGEPRSLPPGGIPAAAMESFHAAAARLRALNRDLELRSLVLTSALPAEGKTTVACHLALALAAKGLRVLLLDANLRRPGLHELLGAGRSPGLTELLREIAAGGGDPRLRVSRLDESLTTRVQNTKVENVLLVGAGAATEDDERLIVRDWLRPLILRFSRLADVVLCDTPALSETLDALDLAAAADGAILVVSTRQTRRRQVERARGLLLSVRTSITGVYLNRCAPDDCESHDAGAGWAPPEHVITRNTTTEVGVTSS